MLVDTVELQSFPNKFGALGHSLQFPWYTWASLFLSCRSSHSIRQENLIFCVAIRPSEDNIIHRDIYDRSKLLKCELLCEKRLTES
jgi:hypothetical protein